MHDRGRQVFRRHRWRTPLRKARRTPGRSDGTAERRKTSSRQGSRSNSRLDSSGSECEERMLCLAGFRWFARAASWSAVPTIGKVQLTCRPTEGKSSPHSGHMRPLTNIFCTCSTSEASMLIYGTRACRASTENGRVITCLGERLMGFEASADALAVVYVDAKLAGLEAPRDILAGEGRGKKALRGRWIRGSTNLAFAGGEYMLMGG